MNVNGEKISKIFTLENKFGLHARPSSLFVKTVSNFSSDVTVTKDDTISNGKSVMELMILAAGPGDRLKVEIDGDDASRAMTAIEALFDSNFGED